MTTSILKKAYWFIGFVLLAGLDACSHQGSVYKIGSSNQDSLCLSLLVWDVYGPFTVQEDSIYGERLSKGKNEVSFAHDDSIMRIKYIKNYRPQYNQVDLNEIFKTNPNDTESDLHESISYLACDIYTEEVCDIFVEIKCGMQNEVFLRDDTLKRIDIQGLNFYPLHLLKGKNRLIVKITGVNENAGFEALLCDQKNKQRLYAEGQSGNIVYPLILEDKIAVLTNAHARLDSCPVTMRIHNCRGEKLREIILQKDEFAYHIPELEIGESYLCSMTMGETTVQQPIVCGNIDKAYGKFDSLYKHLPGGHPRMIEIEEILYRLNVLLHHPTRYEWDWWWQFKIAPLTYQLAYIFNHLDNKPGEHIGETNVQLMAYRSPLDEGMGRYLLVIPNEYTADNPLPLIVAIRPYVINHHHFFTSPQMARQWATNLIQAFANRYNCIVMMPEARMYHDEDLTPFAEAEVMHAINHLAQHYPIDTTRIFLYGNCTGGHRALSLAIQYPDYFAGIALYVPLYKIDKYNAWSKAHAPHNNIDILADMPIMIHGDPLDTHSPMSYYKELIFDAQKNNLPLHLSLKRNSGQFYNVVLVGEEAFDFFKDKKRKKNVKKRQKKVQNFPVVIADFYSRPFIYVYNASDTTATYHEAIDSIRTEYEEYLFSKLPLIADTQLTDDIITNKNLFLIGTHFKHPKLQQIISGIQLNNDYDNKFMSLCIYQHPLNTNGNILLYSSSNERTFVHNISYPWINGMDNKIVKIIQKDL